MTEPADLFFKACESGKGYDGCKDFMLEDATFSCEGLPDITSLKVYVEWMKGIATQTFPDSQYTLHSRTSNVADVVFFATFTGTHTGPGGPVEPTGKSMATQYVYIVNLEDGKVKHMTKVWNNLLAFKALGWA